MLAVPFTAIQLQDEEEDSEANPIIAAIRGSEFVVKHGATIAKWAKTIWRVAVVGDIAWNVYDLVTPDLRTVSSLISFLNCALGLRAPW